LIAGGCQAVGKIGCDILGQQVELVAKLSNDSFERPTTLGVDGRSDAEDGGRPRASRDGRIYDYLGSLAVGVVREKLLLDHQLEFSAC